MNTGLTWSVRVPGGAQLTMLPPGTSAGAETNPECYRVARSGRPRRQEMAMATSGAHVSWIKKPATIGIRKGVWYGAKTEKMD